MCTEAVPQPDQATDRWSAAERAPAERIELSWSHPRVWRSHPLAADPYWVETEVEVVLAGVVVDQLTWSAPLGTDERLRYGVTLHAKWQLLS